MDWRFKYILGGMASLCVLIIATSLLSTNIINPSQDLIEVYSDITNAVGFAATLVMGIALLDFTRVFIADPQGVKGSLLSAVCAVFEGICILMVGIIPIVLCLNLIAFPTIPDILKGLITIPFVAYLLYFIGSPMLFGSFFEVLFLERGE